MGSGVVKMIRVISPFLMVVIVPGKGAGYLCLIYNMYKCIMEAAIINCEDLYLELTQWKSELDFWKQELQSFQQQLEHLVRNITDKKILRSVSRFQYQFDLHHTTLNEFNDAIEAHNYELALYTSTRVDAIDRTRYQKHIEMREQMMRQRELYQVLKKKYYAFLAQLIALDYES
jgi:hypothetical protein